MSKTLELTNNCVVATAGSALAYTPILENTRNEIQSTSEINKIAESTRKNYYIMRSKKLEQNILEIIGMDLDTFYKSNKTLAPELVANVLQGMTQYNYNLSVLIAGVDSTGPHIYRIDNPGRIETYDSLGHCAIGAGQLHAVSTFVANDYAPHLDLNHVVALTYEAKKRSEKAMGVGESSDICIVCLNGVKKLTEDMVTKLDDIYNSRSQQEKGVISRIEEKIKSLDVSSLDQSVSEGKI